MSLLRAAILLAPALVLPASAVAGPVEFGFSTGNVRVLDADKPGLELILQPFQPPDRVFTYTPGGNAPVRLEAVSTDPRGLAEPRPNELQRDGAGVGRAGMNIDGRFSVDVRLVDAASGESGTVTLFGRSHTWNRYSTAGGWTNAPDGSGDGGDAAFWFLDEGRLRLGRNTYSVRGANHFTGGPAVVDVWVNDTPPVVTPEPGTLALAALGLVPLAWLRRRRVSS